MMGRVVDAFFFFPFFCFCIPVEAAFLDLLTPDRRADVGLWEVQRSPR